MLSHLRFHRRGASNPASPTTTHHSQPWSLLASCESPSGPEFDAPLLSSSSTSALPPTLPPITRVTSADADLEGRGLQDSYGASPPDARPRVPRSGGGGFLGGVALQNYRRGVEVQSAGDGSPEDAPRRQCLNTASAGIEVQPSTTSFSTPTDLQTSVTAPTGRRPAGTRLPSQVALPTSNSASAEAPRSKKSLPFLKNPMSTLLMRRKNNQNAPDLRPLPLRPKEEAVYDPRIRGTRVHDFSAPRRKHHASNPDAAVPRSGSQPGAALVRDERARPPDHVKGVREPGPRQLANSNSFSDLTHSDAFGAQLKPVRSSPSVPSTATEANGSCIDQALTPSEHAPASQAPLDDDVALPSQPSSLASLTNVSDGDAQESRRTHPVTRTTRSGNAPSFEMSAVPKHMKSTSSRFSFDMIGAAKQEKLLEERHRKRELERKSTGTATVRDSRFDDFDDDSFDYDAMMDDDGLEERIPGVNADLEDHEGDGGSLEDELDPDNDQENFAGFVFQRSNSNSALTSPQCMGAVDTPRDATGKVIGFAMSKDTPSPVDVPASPESQPMSLNYALSSEVSGLGIRAPGAFAPKPEDDLYFDDGLIDLQCEFAQDLAMEPEYDTAPFDESIFDNNDTDRFGRPVPGAFAQAQELRRAAAQDSAVKRESDVTSRFSAHSGASRSTAHTSPCMETQREGDEALPKARQGDDDAGHAAADVEAESVAAYQAALAAAAHQAAVSGKFQWSSSPRQEDKEPQSQPDESARPTDPNDDDDSGLAYDDLDDFDLDDDDIIAEANASALANDSDEWYGQEFGFYSNPLAQHHTPHGAGSSPKGSDYEYANGGFFGPKGMSGLDSNNGGRMISREPNLTPITERSEYSNRNSFMSMGFPPLSSSTPMIQSPGLAQLAMMADRGDEHMTLSALLRLRSRAWGGSQASLALSKEGSPLSERADAAGSPWNPPIPGPLARSISSHGRQNSFLSTTSYDSEGASASGSPTLTMAMPVLSSPCPARASPAEQHAFFSSSKLPAALGACTREQRTEASWLPAKEPNGTCASPGPGGSSSDVLASLERVGTDETLRRSGRGHHRHSSSADSVSYLRDEHCDETRWIMERRRTSESGEVEILEREVVEGGRI